jgi:two-component system, NarL family, nitrate/nitrite response regulator NarP
MRDMNAVNCLRKEVFRRSEFRSVVREALVKPASTVTVENILPAGPELVEDEEPSRSLALVVEDDAGWRSVLSELLLDAGYEAIISSSYVEAIGLLRREKPDLAVIDLSLASSMVGDNLDGYRLLTSMQRAGVPAVIVSGYADPSRIEQAYNDGLIVACLEKQSFDRKSFRQAVETARSGAQVDPVLRTLTEREREVLELIARGLTNKEIARELTITPNTVKRHLKSLFAKLGVSTRSAASARAIEMRMGKE